MIHDIDTDQKQKNIDDILINHLAILIYIGHFLLSALLCETAFKEVLRMFLSDF